MKRLHPVFHVSLLEPFISLTSIPDRIQDSKTTKIVLSPEAIINPEVSTILDSRKIGRRYDYLIHWKNLQDSENSWTPFAELSTTIYPHLEAFHRQNPSRPHPPRFQIIETIPSPPTSISLPSAGDYNTARSSTPPPKPWSQDYEPPSQSITRSGRLVHPPKRKDA